MAAFLTPIRVGIRLLTATVGTLIVAAGVGCSGGEGGGGGGENGSGDGFDRKALLTSIADDVVLPTYRTFATRADALRAACEQWSQADSTAWEAKRLDARQAWIDAMDTWQRAEVLSVGPAGSSADRTGGQDLRDRIYSWPSTNPCRVDQETVEGHFTSATFFDDELVNVYGLDALEYLLFRGDENNACPPQVTINSDGSWGALGEPGVRAARAAYAAAVAGHVAQMAQALRDAWEPGGGDFRGRFVNAGQSGSPYGSAQVALDEVFAAMWYVERDVKDFKLAKPLGLSPTCTSDVCPDERESQWANRSLPHIRANLESFGAVYLSGFDAWLRTRGAPELADQIGAQLTTVVAAIDATNGTMVEQLAANPEALEAVYDQLKVLTDYVKTQFVSTLGLRVPDEGAGDND